MLFFPNLGDVVHRDVALELGGNVAKTSDVFSRCREICDLPALMDEMYA